MNSVLETFHPVVQSWFRKTFGTPSPPQEQGWKPISAGEHTLIVAPTGSGKTLAAFLWCINHIVEENIAHSYLPSTVSLRPKKNFTKSKGVRVLYISPLKALNNDIHRNLEIPLEGIVKEAREQNIIFPALRSAVRTGDTTQAQRAAIIRNPPDILITTPESLYLMLLSEKTRAIFSTIRYVIVDEIHSLSNNKRGVHLSLTLERLEEVVRHSQHTPEKSFVRIGLSATQKPLEEVAKFLGGMNSHNGIFMPRKVTIIDAGYRKTLDLQVLCPAQSFTDLPFGSVWNEIYPHILSLIAKHRTTLIFVNSRRLAEQLAGRLNEILNGEEHTFNNYAVPFGSYQKNLQHPSIVAAETLKIFAYHGSMSRNVREQLEKELKAGTLRCLISTSALELGIDIGSVDLVIQIQSPKGIARGLQRVGRSGHLVHSISKGRIIVTHSEDALESAVTAKEMLEGNIERTAIPVNCLDVLAQQIVAMVSVESWNVDTLFNLIRRSYNYHTLTEKIFHAVLAMLAGRYTNDAFRELRARIMWDKLHHTLTALPGSSKLAIANAGTIPDRGYFGVYLEDGKTKVGEVDEEFMYESRIGDTFILGSHVWRMTSIDANKVTVAPAPGQPARMPFWKGESLGRTYELSEKIGTLLDSFTKENSSTEKKFLEDFPLDHHSARNIREYILEQQAVTNIVPSAKNIVVEGFRDEIGDPRIVVHSLFGKPVNGLLGIVLRHQLRQRLGIEIQMLYNDSGILFRCSDVERLPLDIVHNLSIETAQQIILEEIPSSPLFGALFRQNAERAMLLPKGLPGKRRPFFLQRLKAADLLQIVKRYSDFPIVIETMRECLNDVLDFEHFKELLHKILNGEIHIHTVQTETPSPFASSVLFEFAAVYMYKWDTPKTMQQQQAATLSRELLAEVVELDSVKTVLRDDAVKKVEEQLQFTSATRRARSAEELMEVFLRIGELNDEEIAERSESVLLREELKIKNSITKIFLGNTPYYILTEEIPLYLPLAVVDSASRERIPEEYFLSNFSREESLQILMLRMLRSHGPLASNYIASRFAISIKECEEMLNELMQREELINGQLFSHSEERVWCYRHTLERIHKASITILRKEITPATFSDFTQLLIHWQHRHVETMEREDLLQLVEQFQGFAVQSTVWEKEIFSTRMKQYDTALLQRAVSSGEIACVGTTSGKSLWLIKGDGNYFLSSAELSLEQISEQAKKVYQFIKEHGASFLTEIREEINLSLAALNKALAELYWCGLLTNDIVEELFGIKRYRSHDDENEHSEFRMPDERIEIINPRRNPLRLRAMRSVRKALQETSGWNGRWALVHTKRILGGAVSDEEKIRRQAQQLLLRYGIVAREIAKREENFLPWTLLAMEFQRMEMRGEIRRGYFVQGLSGMQFALPEAVSLLESIKHSHTTTVEPVVLNACDPANPFGTGIEMQLTLTTPLRLSRISSNFIVLQNGIPILWIENFGVRVFILHNGTFSLTTNLIANAVVQFIAHIRKRYINKNEIILEYIDNHRPSESNYFEVFRSLGFYRDKVQTIRYDVR